MKKQHLLLYRINDRYEPDFWERLARVYSLSSAPNLSKAISSLTEEHIGCIITETRSAAMDELHYLRDHFQTIPMLICGFQTAEEEGDHGEWHDRSVRWLPERDFSSLVKEISSLLGELAFAADLSVFGVTAEQYPARIKKALAVIQNDFLCKELSISKIAFDLNVHRCHFEREFVQHCKISPKQLIIGLKLLLAAHLMKNEGMKLFQIAQLTGFPDYYEFCKLFRKHMGMPPGEFRRVCSFCDFSRYFKASSTRENKWNETKPQQISQ